MLLVKVLSAVFVMALVSATGFASSTETAKKACQHSTEETCKADTKCGWKAEKCSEMKDHGNMKHGDMNHGAAKAEAGKAEAGHEAAPSKDAHK
ncbi:MAG: hypothetical protein KBD78_04200 [Oligoflexales bacterium]|nr:hypothetical protein [Oligoflexales bacterium]